MVRESIKRILGLFLSCVLICGSIDFAFAGDKVETEESQQIKSIVTNLLENIYSERDMYGLEDISFDNLYLGEKISAYQEQNNELKEISVAYYPILENDKVVAIASVIYDEAGTPMVQIGRRFASELQAFTEKRADSNLVALVFDETGQVLYASDIEKNYDCIDTFIKDTGDDITTYTNELQAEPVSLFESINSKDIEFTQIKSEIKLDLKQKEECQDIYNYNSDSNNTLLSRANKDSKYLNVPIVLQGDYFLCWAASAASVGNYMTGKSYTAKNIAKKMDIGYNDGGGIKDAKRALKNVYSITTNRASSAPAFTTTIMNQIQSGNPIWAGFGANDGSLGHAVVLRGYSSSSQGAALSYMDPNESNYQVMSVRKDGIYQFAYGPITYTCECYLEISDF
ncbi:papain-like cysteine protease family protein [Aminipila terrae]|uniref:Peptidase C39-like domain-containing protein n=1 Tax=Aminipila terrae TaxID=2697030 RepID=A0A6P1MAU1_9FIRM|nr:papain-like cysteine protease family protein [Aminipila terrae]QHI71740.1 hypothetical protein Ami3637_04480 [Aminipila terrae]